MDINENSISAENLNTTSGVASAVDIDKSLEFHQTEIDKLVEEKIKEMETSDGSKHLYEPHKVDLRDFKKELICQNDPDLTEKCKKEMDFNKKLMEELEAEKKKEDELAKGNGNGGNKSLLLGVSNMFKKAKNIDPRADINAKFDQLAQKKYITQYEDNTNKVKDSMKAMKANVQVVNDIRAEFNNQFAETTQELNDGTPLDVETSTNKEFVAALYLNDDLKVQADKLKVAASSLTTEGTKFNNLINENILQASSTDVNVVEVVDDIADNVIQNIVNFEFKRNAFEKAEIILPKKSDNDDNSANIAAISNIDVVENKASEDDDSNKYLKGLSDIFRIFKGGDNDKEQSATMGASGG